MYYVSKIVVTNEVQAHEGGKKSCTKKKLNRHNEYVKDNTFIYRMQNHGNAKIFC